MGTQQSITIGTQQINQNSFPYIIAEAGVHHYNSVTLAQEYILAAKIAGADAIKFQTYTASRIATTWAPTYWDDPSGGTQFDIFSERSNLVRADYARLFAYAAEVGITLLSTPFDPDSARLLAEFDMPAYKIASADLTYFPLLEEIASYGKPILLSTGAANYAEIAQTATYLEALNADFALLHCVLSYPTPVKDANLGRILELQTRFPGRVLGYSDHTQPQDTLVACPTAVAFGAKIIEKHFTLNKLLDGDDHYHAVDPIGLKQLVRDCKDAALMTRLSEEMKASETPARTYARRSIVAIRPLKAGTIITSDDIDFKRPGTGLSPNQVDNILGLKLIKDMDSDQLIQIEDLVTSNID